jgi:hypothetical protein
MSETQHGRKRPHHHKKHHHHHHHSGVSGSDEPNLTSPPPRSPKASKACGTSGAMDDDEFPIHETVTNITNQGDTHIHPSQQRGIGVKEAIQHIMEAVSALNTRYERRLALGHALARLIESESVTSIGDVMAVAMAEVNRYAHISDDQPYPSASGTNRYR